jgi:hypothetical protein
MTLSRTTITGQAIGQVHLVLDSVSVSAPEQTGTLHLSVEATPDPINLDSIHFTIVYNRDVAVLDPQLPDCSGGNPLCDYTVTYSGDPESGAIDVWLIRTNRGRTQTLTRAIAKIDIPFFTFLAKEPETPVALANMFVSQASVVSADPGLIQVGTDGCGLELLRSFLQTRTITITSMSPNPSGGSVRLTAYSVSDRDASISVYDAAGTCALKLSQQLVQGENVLLLNTEQLPNGYYTVSLATSSGIATAMLVVQR